MGPSGALARTWLRRNVVATVVLTLVVALAFGAATGAFAAARRSSSSLDRFLAFNRSPDLQVYGESIDIGAVESLPEVVGSSQGAYGLMTVESDTEGPFPPGTVNPFIATAVSGDRSFRPLLIDGREPSTDAADEVAIDEEAAGRLRAGVGDRLRVVFFPPEQVNELYEGGGAFPEPRGASAELTITGIVRHPFDLNANKFEGVDAVSLASADIYLREGFWERHGDEMAAFGGDGEGTELLLRNGVDDVPAVEAAIREMAGGRDVAVEQRNDSVDAIADARETVRFESLALMVFGGLSGLVGIVIVGQALARQVRSELAQRHVLSGVGLTRRDIGMATAMRMAVVAVAGALGGGAVGAATSVATPIGLARRAEVSPGLSVDSLVLVPGAVLTLVAVLAWSSWSGVRSPSLPRASRPTIGARLAAAAARSGAPVPVVAGLSHLAGGSADGTRTPLRSSLGAVAFAIASVVAVGVFSASLGRFIDVPSEHGWTWDLIAGDSDDGRLESEGQKLLGANADVSGFAAVWTGYEDFVETEGTGGDLAIVGIEPLAGDTYIALDEGEPAVGDDEIVLGRRTMSSLGIDIGDEVTLAGARSPATYRVVGTAVLHELVAGGFELDEGAVTSREGLLRLFTGGGDVTVGDSEFAGGSQLSRFLIDVSPGTPVAQAAASVRADFGPTVITHLPPLSVAGLDSTRRLPVAFGTLVGVLGAMSLAHFLLVTVRRRRHDFAVLSALGARRLQLTTTVASLATATAALALVIGVPIGLVVGRSGWLGLARALGSPTLPVVPLASLVSVLVVVAVGANAVAVMPGRLARRLRPADVLRSE